MRRSPSQYLMVACTLSMCMTLDEAATRADENRQEVRIVIKTREFQPPETKVRMGQEVVLVFENQDVEIHAFVPEKLFEKVPVQIEGSGAAQFGEKGLRRLLIGGGSQATIRFVPQVPGKYRYFCDMPGHQMAAHIVVVSEEPVGINAQSEQESSQ